MKEFETDVVKTIIHDNLIREVLIKKNKELRTKDVLEVNDFCSKYKPGARFFVLFELEEDAKISAEARRTAATEEYNKINAALALCSSKFLNAITGNLFLKVNRPKVPTKFFDDRKKALIWLRTMAERV
jgi:hypothetical protein